MIRIRDSDNGGADWRDGQGKKCADCHRKLDWGNFDVDHVIPHSRGGRTHLSNAALLCKSCNATKGARPHRRRLSQRRGR